MPTNSMRGRSSRLLIILAMEVIATFVTPPPSSEALARTSDECLSPVVITEKVESQVHLAQLVDAYRQGDWETTRSRAKSILQCSTSIDLKHYYYSVVFLDTSRAEPLPVRIILHDPLDEEFASTIPGRKLMFEVLLSESEGTTLHSSYEITRTIHPLIAALPKFAAQFNPVLGKISQSLLQEVEKSDKKQTIHVTITPVCLRYTRATVKVHDVITVAVAPSSDEFRAAVDKLKGKNDATNSQLSEC